MTLRVVKATDTDMPILSNDTSIDDAVPGESEAKVAGPITATTSVLVNTLHDEASAPLLSDGPTLAVHTLPGKKLLPDIVKVLLIYAVLGEIESALTKKTEDEIIGSESV